MFGTSGQQGGHVAAAGADFQDLVGFLDAEFLQHLGFDFRGQHGLAAADRDFHVGEGQVAIGRRHEIFALDDEEQVEHFRVEHVPRTNLLLHHVEARLFDVHEILRKLNISIR
ncbi:hypothetical protein SDC9_199195 [bioreactor metagenome]|uniref:Uncharacterized protein n=1 Tax=bioreactor metagenome TaxID=1076179 RepID=A0A645IJT9_9ZZZZ